MKQHIQTQEEWENEMAKKVLELIHNELLLDFPFLSIALNALSFESKKNINVLGNDGIHCFYKTERCIDLFKKNSLFMNRIFLHTIFHCLFSHLWIRSDKKEYLWNIACDIEVEYITDHLNKPSVKRVLTLTRLNTYKQIEEECNGISASEIYYWLETQENILVLQKEFYTDDHSFWPKEEKSSTNPANDAQKNWQKISRQTELENKRNKEESDEGKSLLFAQIKASKSKRNYKEFLEKFSIIREELHTNPDEFDLSYYTYGLRLYKNMPLIEEVETKEMKKIQEFVIVIDTSYSTSNELVKNFLKETYTILSHNDSFFHQSQIHILQCDDHVQKEDIISSEQEMINLLENFTIIGGGSTDFRPAFTYVNQLIEEHKCKNLKGLLYFTDGKGIYPRTRPVYKTAFIYLEDYDASIVPPWAITLQLDPFEFRKKKL